jgi:predicted nucleic acid-binding protein
VKFLLDTCLVSELVKKVPNPNVVSWLDERDEQSLFLSVLTIGELQKGVSKLPASVRKESLQVWIEHDLAERFEGRILELDMDTALTWGKLQVEAEQRGEKLPVMDSLIAATATTHGLLVVTRNTRDLERCQARVLNPWDIDPALGC